MAWFKDDQSQPATGVPRESKYSVEKVEELIETFGPMRLEVTDPRVKVLITKITWGTLPYLNALNGGKPSGAELADVMSSLDMLTQTLKGYVQIQNNPEAHAAKGNLLDLLASGRNALEAHWQKISNESATQSADLLGYNALTGYLTGGSTATS